MAKKLSIQLVNPIAFMFWIGGVVLAKGFWSTLVTVLFPPWAWYLTAEFIIQYINRA